MNRRHFLQSAGAVSASLAFPRAERLLAAGASSDRWRAFEVKTRVEVVKFSGATRVWLPEALVTRTPYQRTLSNRFVAEGGTARMIQSKGDALGIITAEFPSGVKPILTLTSRVETRNHAIDLSSPGHAPNADRAELEHFLRPTKLRPTGS